jgi:nickel-dependent lactate racemase
MRVELPFGRELLPIEVPDSATVLRPNPTAAMLGPVETVREALRNPIGGPPLRERVNPGDDVAIVISDITRPVPNQTLLGPVLGELKAAGVNERDITIVNGTGLHRECTDDELREMLGPDLPKRLRIVQHVARDRSTLVEVGRSPRGVPVEFCRAYVEADVRIVTGFVEPHLFAGYSGGAKGVMPGVAGADIVMGNHGAANLGHPRASWCKTHDNPVWEEIQATVALCPPHFLLNVTIDTGRRITGVFAGDVALAHEKAIEQAASQYQVPISRPFDVVVVTNMGYPADTTFYQSVKGISVAAEAVREGGAIVLVAGCEEGIGSDDYVAGLHEAGSPRELLDLICAAERTPRHDQWQIQCQAMAQARATVYAHTQMSFGDTRVCHVEYSADPSQTVRELVAEAQRRGREGSVLVMPHGQLTVPVVR